MNVLVLDETLELSAPVRGLATLYGWEPHFVGSLHELEMTIRAHGRPALVIVNLQAPLTAWEVGQRLRGLEGDSPVVVLGPRGSAEAPPPVGDPCCGLTLYRVTRFGASATTFWRRLPLRSV